MSALTDERIVELRALIENAHDLDGDHCKVRFNAEDHRDLLAALDELAELRKHPQAVANEVWGDQTALAGAGEVIASPKLYTCEECAGPPRPIEAINCALRSCTPVEVP